MIWFVLLSPISNTLDQLQCALKADSVDDNGEQVDQVKKLFYGKQRTYNISNAGKIRYKEDWMAHIMAYVPPGDSLYAALDRAYDKQNVDVDYEGVSKIEPQFTTISKLPPVLQIMVNRVQFDKQRKMAYKSIDHLELKEVIYMDRYMDDPTLQERREQSWQWKEELDALKQQRSELATSSGMDMEAPDVLANAREYLELLPDQDELDHVTEDAPLSASSELLQSLEDASSDYREDINALSVKIHELETKLSDQFNDLQELPYRLHSVFIHKGTSAGSGHYIIYIYDFTAGMWRSYNDSYVEEVKDVSEIFSTGPTQRPATSYFLVYVKEEKKEDLVECVCREPTEQLPSDQPDIEMTDLGTSEQSAIANSYQNPQMSFRQEVNEDGYVQLMDWPTPVADTGWANHTVVGHEW